MDGQLSKYPFSKILNTMKNTFIVTCDSGSFPPGGPGEMQLKCIEMTFGKQKTSGKRRFNLQHESRTTLTYFSDSPLQL